MSKDEFIFPPNLSFIHAFLSHFFPAPSPHLPKSFPIYILMDLKSAAPLLCLSLPQFRPSSQLLWIEYPVPGPPRLQAPLSHLFPKQQPE